VRREQAGSGDLAGERLPLLPILVDAFLELVDFVLQVDEFVVDFLPLGGSGAAQLLELAREVGRRGVKGVGELFDAFAQLGEVRPVPGHDLEKELLVLAHGCWRTRKSLTERNSRAKPRRAASQMIHFVQS